MQTGSRVGWTIVLTVALGANIGLMFATVKKFDPLWFSIGAAAYLVFVLLIWVLGRGTTGRRVGETIDVDMSSPTPASGAKHSSSTWSMPVRPGNEPTGLPKIEVAPRNAPDLVTEAAPATPEPFVERGFTLFARTTKGKTSYVFSKGRVIGGIAVPLPEGRTVAWDRKTKKPVLEALPMVVEAVVEERDEDDSLAVGVPTAAAPTFDVRRCAAMPTPGDFCNNPAKVGEKYCARHAGFESFKTTLVVKPDGREGKAVKGLKIAAPDFVVRTPKGTASKGGALKTVRTTLDVRTAKPKVGKALRPGAANIEVDVPRGNAPAKAWRVAEPRLDLHPAQSATPAPMRVAEPRLNIREPRGAVSRPLRVAEPRLDIRAPTTASSKPLRVKEPILHVRAPTTASSRPLRVKEPILHVRAPTTASSRPLRVKEPILNVRRPTTASSKPLRVKEPILNVRAPTTAKARPLRVKEPTLHVREPSTAASRPLKVKEPVLHFRKQPKNTSPPLKIRETYLDVRAPRSHGVRPMKLVDPVVDVRTSRPKVKGKPLRVVEPVLDIHAAAQHEPHAMRLAEDRVVVRPKQQLSDAKPLRLVETELEIVRSKPKNLSGFKDILVPKDPDVVRDLKKPPKPASKDAGAKRRK